MTSFIRGVSTPSAQETVVKSRKSLSPAGSHPERSKTSLYLTAQD